MTPGRSWAEANPLFRSDPQWVGGDGSYSFPIGQDRVVWIFADTFIAASAGAGRAAGSVMINNTVGVQTGCDPSKATMEFYWPSLSDGRPASFFEEPGPGYLWPCNGALLDDRLVLFAMRVRTREMTPEENETRPALASFEVYDWVAMVVENPLDVPSDWQVNYLDHADSRFAVTLGAGSLLVEDGYVYVHAVARDGGGQYLARWAASDVSAGRLGLPEWWCGETRGWLAEGDCESPPVSTVPEPQVEFTIHRDDGTGKLIWLQTLGIEKADIGMRTADRIEGPWSEFTPVYHPPEGDVEDGIVYGAKAHPEQRGAADDLVLTYNNNSLRVSTLMAQPELYFPTFVRVPRGAVSELS
jgi:hypothetical protein